MKKAKFFMLALLLPGMISAQNDSLSFTLCDEFEYSGTFSAYSGTFDKLDPNYLYVATKELGLHIYQTNNCTLAAVDILPNSFFGNLKVSKLFQKAHYLYVGLGDFQAAFGSDVGLAILNVQDPLNPILTDLWRSNTFRNGVAAIKVFGDYAYLGIMDDGLLILNVSDKANIQFESHLQLDPNFPSVPGLFSVPHARGLDVDGNYVYVSNDAGGLRMIDISDKAHPVEVGMYVNQYINDSAGRAYNHVIVENGYAYNSVDYCGLEVVDVSDPANPSFVSHFNLWGCNFTNWEGSDGHANEMVKLENEEILLVSSGDAELIALDISDPEEIRLIGNYGMDMDSAATWGMALQGDKLALFYVDNSGIPAGFPQPYYSDFGGLRLLEWQNTATGLLQEELEVLLGLEIYPNPFSQSLMISTSFGHLITQAHLFDLHGNLLYEFSGHTPSFQIDLLEYQLPLGVYFLQIHSDSYLLTKALLKIGF